MLILQKAVQHWRAQIRSDTITASLKSADYLKELYLTLVEQS